MWFSFCCLQWLFFFSLCNYLFSYGRVILLCWEKMITRTSDTFLFYPPSLLCSTVVFLCNISPKLSITDQVTTLLRHVSNTSHVIQQAKKTALYVQELVAFEPQHKARSGHLHASLMGAIPLCSCIFLTFTSLVCLFFGFWVYSGGWAQLWNSHCT